MGTVGEKWNSGEGAVQLSNGKSGRFVIRKGITKNLSDQCACCVCRKCVEALFEIIPALEYFVEWGRRKLLSIFEGSAQIQDTIAGLVLILEKSIVHRSNSLGISILGS
jgi:hypothetical protein